MNTAAMLWTLIVTSYDAHSGVEYTWTQTMTRVECVSERARLTSDDTVSFAVCLPTQKKVSK